MSCMVIFTAPILFIQLIYCPKIKYTRIILTIKHRGKLCHLSMPDDMLDLISFAVYFQSYKKDCPAESNLRWENDIT